MRTKLVWIFAVVVLIALPAFAGTARVEGATAVYTASAQEQSAAGTYWTAERMAAAKPFPMPVDRSGAAPEVAALTAPTGRPGSSPGGMPDPDADRVAQSAFWRDWQPLEGEALEQPAAVAGTFGVYTYYDVNYYAALWNVYPHRTVGRLYFNTSSGPTYCSGVVVSGQHVVTAAHCAYNTGTNQWYGGWVFVPAYRAGSAPFGSFSAASARVLNSYVALSGAYSISTWARHDVAILHMNKNGAGQFINSAVGYAGRSWNFPTAQLVFNPGYAWRNVSNVLLTGAGSYLRACTAETYGYNAETLRGGCYYGSGMSGSPWLRTYRPFQIGAVNYVNGVTSGMFTGQQNLYAGRFNSANIVVLCSADGC